MKNSDILPLLSDGLPFWENLSETEQSLLLSGTRPVRYQSGDNIHSPSHECVGVLLVKRGELRTYILSEGGKEVTLFRLGSGDACILSASCLLSNITFDVFIDAQQDTEALLMDPAVFSRLQSRNLYVENYALRLAADRFSDVMWTMEQILFMSFDARLAVFLLDESAKTGADHLTLTHEQIAKLIGSAREVVSRMLKYFESEGLVRLHRGSVELLRKPELRQLAQANSK